ncbi:nitrogen fixation protein NifQ [Mitsuaria sp. GD03876]|uniref:nitrogen fixation protein NifQ n=1 Tax=Mitsuaria sp. GD03876 TaxID=2975399 RepID=UPI002446879C|nr:nitrogen fixation protein NifQ [Mitsuaria sp. GD03876]MDH0866379.1 nitrogen fixation protein NifQ [Mitsuaria sp. GD03876]
MAFQLAQPTEGPPVAQPDRDQAALRRLQADAPRHWDEADRDLFAVVGHHVQSRTDAGDFPPNAADPGALAGPLYRFLLQHRARKDSSHARLCGWLASACMGSHHLWQDLGLAERPQVSRLLRLAFPTLHDSNTRQLRWKRHLFLSLGESLGRPGLRPPKCDGCPEVSVCMDDPQSTVRLVGIDAAGAA